jgi:hypothetical protein
MGGYGVWGGGGLYEGLGGVDEEACACACVRVCARVRACVLGVKQGCKLLI